MEKKSKYLIITFIVMAVVLIAGTFATCGGHALSWTAGWYSDESNFIYASNRWFARGGSTATSTKAGIFNFEYASHSSAAHYIFRTSLVLLPN